MLNQEDDKNENNIINTNSNNNILLKDNNDISHKDTSKSLNEEERQSLDSSFISQVNNIKLEDLELGSKILCPTKNCFSNAIIMINPFFFEIYSDCGCDSHKNKMNIFNFVKNSGILKQDKEICDYCKKTYQVIKNNNKNLYKCSCDKNICENCKENKENKEIKEHLDKHNLIDFKVKDYTCPCNKKGKKFINYCFDCKKNYCLLCSDKHKNHDKKKFSQIYQVEKEKIKVLKEKLEEQKKKIHYFNDTIETWFDLVKKTFFEYKKKLDLYVKLNEKIIDQYNTSKNYFAAIKNIEYITFDFDNIVLDLKKYEINFMKQNEIIFKFLKEQFLKFFEPGNSKINVLNNRKEIKTTHEFNGPVNHICELKKEDLLIVNISNPNNNNEELYIYKKSPDFNFNEIHSSIIEHKKILSLSELKNGNLLIIQNKAFKIYEINKKEKVTKLIQEQEIEEQNYYFKDILELFNGYLVSLTVNLDKKNKIIFWRKNLITGKYKMKKERSKEKAIAIIEKDKNSFFVFCDNNELFIWNINTYEETPIGNLNLKEGINYELQKILKINENGLIFYYKEILIIFNLSTLQTIEVNESIDAICNVSNSNFFLASFNERNNKGIYLISCYLDKKEVKCDKFPDNFHNDVINCIYQLDNGDIITGSSDKTIKIFELNTNYIY